MELRCKGKLHGIIKSPSTGELEVKCSSKFCGAQRGQVLVFHSFNLSDGSMKTRKYTDVVRKESQCH